MKSSLHIAMARCLVSTAMIALCFSALGQLRSRPIEEPTWMKLRITEVNAGVYAEGTFEETSYQNSGTSVTYNRLFVGPSFGVNMAGSVYHPNFFRYQITTEGSYGWGNESVESGVRSVHRDRMEYLGRFYGSADIMANKPLRGNVSANYDHAFRDYDFFNRVTVDSLRYGSRISYDNAPWRTSVSYSHRSENSSGLIGSTTTEDDSITLQANHDRSSGQTTFNYAYNQYERGDIGFNNGGRDHAVTISDLEKFGSRDQFSLNSGLSYYRREFSEDPSDEIMARANLGIDHRSNLSSYHDLNYDHYQSGTFTSDGWNGQSQLRHQLYESLTSTLTAQAEDFEVSDQFSSGYTRRFGGGFAEAYTKRVGANHHLRINNSLMIEHVEQQSIRTVENERHTFTASVGGSALEAFFLNLPNVNELTIVLRETDGTERVLGIDYGISTVGPRTLIERLAGSRIPSGATVILSYQANPTSAGSYDSFNEAFQIRFDLWNNFWGIYARVNLFLNNAEKDLRVQDLASYTFGTDLNWRWFRTGVEYEIYDSDQANYTSLRLFQSCSFKPDPSSSLGIQFSEAWTDYTDDNRSEANYRFITIYHHNFTPRLRVNIDGGIHLRQGKSVDQTLATVRPSIDYVVGRTTIRAAYDYEYQLFLSNEERNKHLFTLRVSRAF